MVGTVINLKEISSDAALFWEMLSNETTQTSEAGLSVNEEISVIFVSGAEEIQEKYRQIQAKDNQRVSVERIYPHAFDGSVTAGSARKNILNALADARDALDSFNDGDFQSLSTRLTIIAATMKDTHKLTEFNESLGGVVSYIRRATLTANVTELTRSSLNALIYVLNQISDNPMVDLDDASELIDHLSSEGWTGEHSFSKEVIDVLFGEKESEGEPVNQEEMDI